MAVSTIKDQRLARGFGYQARPAYYFGMEIPDHVLWLDEEFNVVEDMFYVVWRTKGGNVGRMPIRGHGDPLDTFDERINAALAAMKLTD